MFLFKRWSQCRKLSRIQSFVTFQQVSYTYRFGVGVVASGVTNHTVTNQTVAWKQKGVAHRGEQHLLGLRKEPLDGDVT